MKTNLVCKSLLCVIGLLPMLVRGDEVLIGSMVIKGTNYAFTVSSTSVVKNLEWNPERDGMPNDVPDKIRKAKVKAAELLACNVADLRFHSWRVAPRDVGREDGFVTLEPRRLWSILIEFYRPGGDGTRESRRFEYVTMLYDGTIAERIIDKRNWRRTPAGQSEEKN